MFNKHYSWPLAFLPAIFIALTISILSGIPGNEIHLPPIWNLDKYLHLFVYLVQSSSIVFGFRLYYGKKFNRNKATLIAILLSTLLGGILEILQEYVFINRSFDYYDLLANTIGSILGAYAAKLFYWYKSK